MNMVVNYKFPPIKIIEQTEYYRQKFGTQFKLQNRP